MAVSLSPSSRSSTNGSNADVVARPKVRMVLRRTASSDDDGEEDGEL